MEKWTDRLTIDMIPEQYRQLAEITGIQPLLTLAAQYGGSNLPVSCRCWTLNSPILSTFPP